MKNILFSCYFANGWHGSIIHILEIGEHFVKEGHNVDIAAFLISKEIKEYASKLGIRLLYIQNINLYEHYDLFWSLHFLSTSYLIGKGLKYDKIIYNSLSSHHSLELPPINDDNLLIVANSIETKKVIELSSKNKHILVMPNVVPERFIQKPKESYNLDKIAVISNHIPAEVLGLKKYLNIDFYGFEHKYQLITPEILKEYSLVISIGKTVPYCFLSHIPVYVYDIHGGPGYITVDNIDYSAEYNFSGRPFGYMSIEELKNDIIENYDKNIENLTKLYEYGLENHLLSYNIDKLMKNIKSYNFHYDNNIYNSLTLRKEMISVELILDLINKGNINEK